MPNLEFCKWIFDSVKKKFKKVHLAGENEKELTEEKNFDEKKQSYYFGLCCCVKKPFEKEEE